MLNVELIEKSGTLQKIKKLFTYIKMGKDILTIGNIEIGKKILPLFFERCRYWKSISI